MLTLFEALLTKNAVDNLKFVSRKRVVIWLNGCPFHKCGTRAYQSTKYERIRILSCVRDFFGFYRHLLLNYARPWDVFRSQNVYAPQRVDRGGGKCTQYNLYHTNHM